MPGPLFYLPKAVALDSAGDPRSGAKAYFYAAGTLTALDTYSDSALTTPNANPVVADSAGVFGPIYLDNVPYRLILKDSSDVTIYDQDNINIQSIGFASSVTTKSGSYTVTTSDDGKFIEVDATGTITLPAVADAEAGFNVAVFNTGTGVVTVDGNLVETVNNAATAILNPGEGIILACDGDEWLGVQSWKFGNKCNSQAAPYTILTSDRGAMIVVTTAGTVTLPTVADAGAGFSVMVVNVDSTDTTVDGNGAETINDQADYTLGPYSGVTLVCDGDEWFAIGAQPASATERGVVELATLAEAKTGSDTARVLTPDVLHNLLLSFTWTGTTRLTGSAGTSSWTVTNPATGKYTITHTLGLSDVDALQLTPGHCRTANGDTGITIVNRGANSFEVWVFIAGSLTNIEASGAATVLGYLTE